MPLWLKGRHCSTASVFNRDVPLCSKCEVTFGCHIFATPLNKGWQLTQLIKETVWRKKFLILPEHAESGKSWQSGNTQNPLKIHSIVYYTGTVLCVAQSKLLFQARKCFLNILSPWQSSPGLQFSPWLLQRTPVKSTVLHTASQAARKAHLAVQPAASSWACVLCTALSAWVIACHKLRSVWKNNITCKRKRGLQLWSTKHLLNRFNFN